MEISSLAGECGAVVLNFCSAVRGLLNDNHGGPCNPPGVRMVDALADVQESLGRIAASENSGPAFSHSDRLKGFIDRGVAEQHDTFSRVRAYTVHVREGATLIPTLDAYARHPGVFTEQDLAGVTAATAPASQVESEQRHGIMKKARSKKRIFLLKQLETRLLNPTD